MARPVRGVGLAEVPAREPRPVAGADAGRLRRHLLLAPLRSRDAARGDDGRARHGGSPGQGALRRHLLLQPREDARGGRDHARARDADPDPPAVLLAAEPLDRAGAAGRRRGRGHRLHRLLAARTRVAHGPLLERHSGGLARQPRPLALAGPAERADAGEGVGAERDCGRARSEPRPDGARLGPARPARDVGADRRQQRRAARGERRRSRPTRLRPGRAGGDRPLRDGVRHQPLGRARAKRECARGAWPAACLAGAPLRRRGRHARDCARNRGRRLPHRRVDDVDAGRRGRDRAARRGRD